VPYYASEYFGFTSFFAFKNWKDDGKYVHEADDTSLPTPTGIAILKANSLKVPCAVISNGIDLQQFTSPSQLEKKKIQEKYHLPDVPFVLYVGRLDKEKKVNILMKALPLLKDKLSFHVVIAGTGIQLEDLQNMAKNLHVDNVVSFIGFVEESDLSTLYSLASVLVMPSTAELQSLVTMEAMALGLPVIGARAGAIPYLVKTGKNGFLFNPDNAKDLAEKLQRLLSDEALQRNMGKQSCILIKKHGIQLVTTELEALYIKILEEKKLLLQI
jgi:glycosyltransferase involved in cell wall biosynthesis